MKVLFAFDNKFCRGKDGRYYSDGQFPYRIWQRYLESFDEIVVAGRVRPLRPDERLEDLDLSNGPRVSFVEIPNLSGLPAALTNRAEAKRKIADALQGCDALIVRVVSEISRVAYQLAQEMQKPWAVEVTSCTFDCLWNYGNWQGKAYAPVAAYYTRKLVSEAPFAFYVTQEFLQRRYPCRGVTVGCSDVQLVDRNEDVLAKRLARLNQARGPCRVGLIGSLAQGQKGVDTALNALGQIKARLPSFQFLVLGGGDPTRWQKLATEHGVADRTEFCGVLPSGSAVNAWLDSIDVYIQPSYNEGLPRALIEAMSRACPALGSNVGGIPELLGVECLHRPGDSRSLAALLERAMTDIHWQASQAEVNFRKTAQYEQTELAPVRSRFWLAFADYCRKVSGRSDSAIAKT